MPEISSTNADTDAFADAPATTQTRALDYASQPNRTAPWYERVQKRRLTLRKIGLYALAAIIMMLSSPILATWCTGALLVVAGMALRIWTFGHLEKNQRMVTTGPYAHTRNPAYLGSFLIVCGFVMAAGNPYSAAGMLVWGLGLGALVVFFLSYLPRKYTREYPRLRAAFPTAYGAHAANVPHFFPRLTPWRSGDTQAFSWTRVRANHETWWTAGLSLGLVLL